MNDLHCVSPLLAAEVEVKGIWIVTFELNTCGWENKQNMIFAAYKKVNSSPLSTY